MFEDTGALLPDSRCILPHRPPWIGGHRHASLDPRPATGETWNVNTSRPEE